MFRRRVHERAVRTLEGTLRLAIVLEADGQVAIYAFEQDDGYIPLVGPYLPFETTAAGTVHVGTPQRQSNRATALSEWREWVSLDNDQLCEAINLHRCGHRTVAEPRIMRPPGFPKDFQVVCPFCGATHVDPRRLRCRDLVVYANDKQGTTWLWSPFLELSSAIKWALWWHVDLCQLADDTGIGCGQISWHECAQPTFAWALSRCLRCRSCTAAQRIGNAVRQHIWVFVGVSERGRLLNRLNEFQSKIERATREAY